MSEVAGTPKRECLNRKCRRLHSEAGGYCARCRAAREQARDAERGGTTARGYGAEHQRARPEVLAGDPLCHWCQQAVATVADHAGRNPDGSVVYVPACVGCNATRANRSPARRRGGTQQG